MSHPNARLPPHGRRLLADRIRSGWTVTAAARFVGISRQTGSKWAGRQRREGDAGLVDRSSAARRQPRAHPASLVARLYARRREDRVGPHVLAWELGLARSTALIALRTAADQPDARQQPDGEEHLGRHRRSQKADLLVNGADLVRAG